MAAIGGASLETLILWITLLAGAALSGLPYDEVVGGGGRGYVPSIVFKHQPESFYALVVCLVLAGSAASGAVMHRGSFPKYARICRTCAASALLGAAAAVVWAVAAAWIAWSRTNG